MSKCLHISNNAMQFENKYLSLYCGYSVCKFCQRSANLRIKCVNLLLRLYFLQFFESTHFNNHSLKDWSLWFPREILPSKVHSMSEVYTARG